jgi:hypothetical protein
VRDADPLTLTSAESTTMSCTNGSPLDDSQQHALQLLRRVAPLMLHQAEPTASTQLRAMGLDSLALMRLFVELERAFRLTPWALRSLLRANCTFGEVCGLVRVARR